MLEMELTRVRGDRRRYAIDGIGGIRVSGFIARSKPSY
jgi:hypothetical protein